MILQESYNHSHNLCEAPIGIRMGYSVPAFILVLLSQSCYFNITALVLFLCLIKLTCAISYYQLCRLYVVPLLFILMGCITIAFSFKHNTPISLQNDSTYFAVKIFFRSLAIVSIAFFVHLTHSISELAVVMRFLKLPNLFVELFVLTYKFILNLLSGAKNMYKAQKLRLAYTNRANSIRSFSFLLSNVFQRAIQQNKQLEYASESRLGSLDFSFLQNKKTFEKKQLIAPIIVTTVLIVSFFILMPYGG